MAGELPSNARQLFLYLKALILRTYTEKEACAREKECDRNSRNPGLAAQRKVEDFMKLCQSTLAILSAAEGGLNSPGKYYIPCVKAIFFVFLPAIKKQNTCGARAVPKCVIF